MTLTRREILAAGAALPLLVQDWAVADTSRYAAAFRSIDAMAAAYLKAMNAPGMTLVIADRSGPIRVATYGFSDLARKEPVRSDHLFHIGSITKSFVAIALLQLREEGKIDFHAPVTRYLPWLRVEPRDVITTHHLLTHSSGLPSGPPLFLSDPGARHVSGFTPGSHFSYCNMGYRILGYLLEVLDGKPYPEVIEARVFKPLGMSASVAYIAPEIRERTANSYMPYFDERPYPRQGRVADAPQIIYEGAAGSISSTAGDMGRYVAMIASGGKGVLSPAAFEDFTKRHIRLEEGAEPGYGYGLFTDTLDEHRIVRHTGGMVSFMSAMHIDLVDGIGAFASINAQQGYRPNPVSIYALRAIRAVNANKPLPDAPPVDPPAKIADAKDLAGVYTAPSGEKLEFVAEGESLWLLHGGKRVPVESSTSGLIARHPDFERYALSFEREKKTTGPALSVAYGPRWFAGEKYTGPRTFDYPAEWNAFAGHYRNDSPWNGSVKIYVRQGQLWLDGAGALRPVDAVTFRAAEPEWNPEWIQFLAVVNGKSRHLKLSGEDFWRVDVS